MFQTSVITDEISQDLQIAIALAKRFGLDAVELRSVYNKGSFELSVEEWRSINRQIKAAGLRVSAISAPFYKCDMNNAQEIAEHCAGLERCIAAAEMLGTDKIRGFAFWKNGVLSECLNQIVALYQKPIARLRASGMTLVMESDPSVNTANAAQLAEVLDAIDSPQIKALWDPGNNLYAAPIETPYPDGYRIIQRHMAHVHLKDAVLDAKGNAVGCRFGKGLVDFRGQLQALAEDRYTGYVVMETHYRKAAALSEEILKRPGGSAFSADGYEPTVECLESFQTMLRQLTQSRKVISIL